MGAHAGYTQQEINCIIRHVSENPGNCQVAFEKAARETGRPKNGISFKYYNSIKPKGLIKVASKTVSYVGKNKARQGKSEVNSLFDKAIANYPVGKLSSLLNKVLSIEEKEQVILEMIKQ